MLVSCVEFAAAVTKNYISINSVTDKSASFIVQVLHEIVDMGFKELGKMCILCRSGCSFCFFFPPICRPLSELLFFIFHCVVQANPPETEAQYSVEFFFPTVFSSNHSSNTMSVESVVHGG